MAKQAPAPTTAVATKSSPATPTPSIHSARFAAPAPQSTGQDRGSLDVKVVKWNNGSRGGFSAPADAKVDPVDPNKGTEGNAGEVKVEPAKSAEEAENGTSEVGELTHPPKDGEPPKKTSVEKRRDALAALESERKLREIETAAKKDREALAALQKQLEDGKKAPLRDRLAALGIDRDDLLERLLKKDKDLEPVEANPAAGKESPELQALRDEIKELREQLKADKGSEEQQGVARAVAGIAEQLKDADLPLTHSGVTVTMKDGAVMNGHMLTLQVAHQMWLDSGKSGHPRDFVERAGNNVEAHLRGKFPKLAERLGSKTTEQRPAGKAVGQRTGAAARTDPKPLPMEKHLRDAEIKREMGWT